MKHENLKSLFTAIADAIRTKTGSTDTIAADDFPEAIQGIEGGSADFDAFNDGAIIWFHNGTEITKDMVPDTGFDAVYCPNAASIGEYAFHECDSLTTVSLPNATSIGEGAFNSCEALTTVSLPNTTSIGDYAFNSCHALTSVSLPNATSIGNNAFYGCDDLTSVSLPNATSIGESAFQYCVTLTSVSLPNATSIGHGAFDSCEALTTVSLPNATSIGDSAFFSSNGILDTLILRSATMCDMVISAIVGTKIIDETGMPTGEGFIYVPTALYEAYIADWIPKIIEFATANGVPMDEPTATYIATAILRKLEDYTVDGTTTGELDESKI